MTDSQVDIKENDIFELSPELMGSNIKWSKSIDEFELTLCKIQSF